MKKSVNWRHCVLSVPLAAGFLAVSLIFGEDDRPADEWISIRVCLAAVAALCFWIFGRLAKKWKHKLKTP